MLRKRNHFTPYIGAGAGFTVPRVEPTSPGASRDTHRYQFGGPALQAQVGIEYSVTQSLGAFAEYKANYSWLDVEMDGGGRLKTEIMTDAINLGITLGF